ESHAALEGRVGGEYRGVRGGRLRIAASRPGVAAAAVLVAAATSRQDEEHDRQGYGSCHESHELHRSFLLGEINVCWCRRASPCPHLRRAARASARAGAGGSSGWE